MVNRLRKSQHAKLQQQAEGLLLYQEVLAGDVGQSFLHLLADWAEDKPVQPTDDGSRPWQPPENLSFFKKINIVFGVNPLKLS